MDLLHKDPKNYGTTSQNEVEFGEGVWYFVCQPRDLSHDLNLKKKSFLRLKLQPHTVDGKNWDSPVDMVNIPLLADLQGFMNVR